MDARSHVAAGLQRLVDRDGVPDHDLARWRNLLLDEVGSDHRALVMLLVSVVDAGLVTRMQRGASEGTSWVRLRTDVAIRLATERFLQPDVAQWAAESWGVALGLSQPAPPTIAAGAVAAKGAASPLPRAHVPSRTRRGAPMAPRSASTGPARRTPTPAAAPASTLSPKQSLLGKPIGPRRILGFPPRTLAWAAGVYAVVLLYIAISNARRDVPIGLMSPAGSTRTPAPTSSGKVSTVTANEPMQAVPTDSNTLRPGLYEVVVRLSSITGDKSCNEVWRSMPEAQSETRTIRVDERGGYHFDTSPDISWTPDALGYFKTPSISSERGGVRYTFQMSGRSTATGLDATTETFSTAVIRWRQKQSCRMLAHLTATPLR